ncbi:MAG TPA: F0F1 ATP synthase subunit B' [Acidisphaera sp.]|nr:F0F1 ATP synthase subunit B' [Acidisphaera sp.]
MRRSTALRIVALPVLALLSCVAGTAHAAEGMPQLAFGNPLTLTQVYWGALIFVLFYVAVRYVGLPQVTDVLEAREQKIRSDLEAARGAKATADRTARELVETTAKARAEAQAAINAAVEEARAAAAKQTAELAAKLDAHIAEAEARIGVARQAAMGALWQVAGETAAAILARLAGQEGDRATLDAAVGAQLSGRGL